MPLNCIDPGCYQLAGSGLIADGFDQAIRHRARLDLETGAELLNSLMMHGVHPGVTPPGVHAAQPGVWFDAEVVLQLVVALELAVGKEAGALSGDVLEQGPLEDHVEHLKPAADAEHRPVERDGGAHQFGLVSVAHPISGPLRPERRLAVALRRHIASALKDQPIEPGEEVTSVDARSRRGQEQWDSATRHQPVGQRLLQVEQGLALEDRTRAIGVKEAGCNAYAELGKGHGTAGLATRDS